MHARKGGAYVNATSSSIARTKTNTKTIVMTVYQEEYSTEQASSSPVHPPSFWREIALRVRLVVAAIVSELGTASIA